MSELALSAFHAEKPDARVRAVFFELHLEKSLWNEVLSFLRERLSNAEGRWEESGVGPDLPDTIYVDMNSLIEKSATVAGLSRLLENHGMKVQNVIVMETRFRRSIIGQEYSETGAKPGVGILQPGTIVFILRSFAVQKIASPELPVQKSCTGSQSSCLPVQE